MDTLNAKYIRYIDDVLILAETRWKLRNAVQETNRIFEPLRLEKHPVKTFIGRIAKGFDFLGYYFTPEKMSLAAKTIANFTQHIHRLYEQGAPENRIGEYVTRWFRWVSGVRRVLLSRDNFDCGLHPPIPGR